MNRPPSSHPARLPLPRLARLSRLLASCIVAGGLIGGCATTRMATPLIWDLGPATAAAAAPMAIPPVTVADVTSAPWLDSQAMLYRLNYANDQQPRPYANGRWSMPPPQLLAQRVKTRLAQAGGVVLSGADGAINIPVLRLETDDFIQRFASETRSDVHVAVRASLFDGRVLRAQKSFEQMRAAPTADAAGGASAMALATDALIADMSAWLATLPPKK